MENKIIYLKIKLELESKEDKLTEGLIDDCIRELEYTFESNTLGVEIINTKILEYE